MAKPAPKKNPPSQISAKRATEQGARKQAQQGFVMPPIQVAPVSPITSFRWQAVFIVFIGILIYFNSVISHWEIKKYGAEAKIPAADTAGKKNILFNYGDSQWCVIPTFNRYALDDDIVMRLNEYVQQGFAGIPKIMRTDSYDSFFRSMGSEGELQGGRYRPLSIVTFAIEQQIFGERYGLRYSEAGDSLRALQRTPGADPRVINRLIGEKAGLENKIAATHEDIAPQRHVTSVLLYILSVVILLLLLRNYVFRYVSLKGIHPHDLAFLASLIFLVHPIHTEVVANVKSRDEILSFLFICLTFIYVFKYFEKKSNLNLALGCFFYFLALLSKEWAVTLVALIPMSLYIFRKETLIDSIKKALPYIGVALLYIFIRSLCVGKGKVGEITEVLNNPYVFAKPVEKFATEIYILAKYIFLLVFPKSLSADYSWKTIPYSNFGDGLVWVSLAVHIALVWYMVKFVKQRNWISFAIAFYLSHLFLVSNLAMPIGATMGERLIYHSSLGFAMVAAFGLLLLLNKATGEPPALVKGGEGESERAGIKYKLSYAALVLLLIVPLGYKTIERNPDWETDNVLFMHDAWVVPNSVLANGNAGKAFIEGAQKDTTHRLAMLDSAIYHLEVAVKFHPKYVNGYLNLGLAWLQKKDLDKAEYYWNMARQYFPTHPFFRQSYDPALSGGFVQRAEQESKAGHTALALDYITRAVKYDNSNPTTWFHYAGLNFSMNKLDEAERGWKKCLELNPGYTEAKKWLDAVAARRQELQGQMRPPVQ